MINNVCPKIVLPLLDVDEKYGRARQATDDTIIRRRKHAISMHDNSRQYLIHIAFLRQ